MDNLETAVPREGSEEINAFVGKGRELLRESHFV